MAQSNWVGRGLLVTFGAAGGLVLAEACSEPVGRMLVEAGTALMDAGTEDWEDDAGGPQMDAASTNEGGNPSADAASGRDSGLLADASELMRDAGELLRDAGMVLMDAGNSIRDGASDASAQPSSLASRSGSRIEMRATPRNGTDGSVMGGYATPYDTQRNEPCNIVLAADGKNRCMPNGIAGYATDFYFSDAACSQPVFAATDNGCPPKYAYSFATVQGACGSLGGHRFFLVGPKHVGNYYLKSGTNCTSTAQAPGNAWYVRGAEIPSSAFVEFTDGATMTL